MYSSNRSDDIKARPWSNTGTLGFTISINPGNDDRDKQTKNNVETCLLRSYLTCRFFIFYLLSYVETCLSRFCLTCSFDRQRTRRLYTGRTDHCRETNNFNSTIGWEFQSGMIMYHENFKKNIHDLCSSEWWLYNSSWIICITHKNGGVFKFLMRFNLWLQ